MQELGLSTYVENVVRWHHEPNPEKRKKVLSEEAGEVIDLVIIANWAVNHLKFGFGGHNNPDTPSDALFGATGLIFTAPKLTIYLSRFLPSWS